LTPYQHPAILAVLRQFFTPSVKLYLPEKYYTCFEKGENGKIQLPDVMVAFVATAVCMRCIKIPTLMHLSQVHASLAEWQSGTMHRINFSADHFASVYRDHKDRLGAIAESSPKGYIKLKEILYRLSR
jgi:Domain of unknown function (DUF6532)